MKIKRKTAFLKVLHCIRIIPTKLRGLARDFPLQKWWCGWWGLTKTSVRGVPYWWYTPLIPRLPVRNEITWWSGAVELSHFGDCVSLRWTIRHCVFQIAVQENCASGIYHLWPESVDLHANQIGKCRRRVSYINLCAITQEGYNEHGGETLEPLTASAAYSKMAASVAFIFCWSTFKFHCLPQQS